MVQRSGRDILGILCRDHDELRRMLDRLEHADGASRRTLLLRLRDEMHAHGRVEEEVLYPAFSAMLDDEAAEKAAEDGRDEHSFIDRLLDEAARVPEDSNSFGEDLLLVRETFLRHADKEEDDVFPRLQRACSEQLLLELGVQASQRKEILRRQSRRRRASAVSWGQQPIEKGMSKTELIRKLRSK